MFLQNFWLQVFCIKHKDALNKFYMKSYEGIFIDYSSTSKAHKVFMNSTLTIEKSMHVKFEKSNPFVKNVLDTQIEIVLEELTNTSIKDTFAEKVDKEKEQNEEVQGQQLEATQQLPKNWRYASSHPKKLIVGDVLREYH